MSSTIQIKSLVKKAKEDDYRALALTDEHVLHGVIPFYQACIEHQIKPIIGMATTLSDEQTEEKVVLLAKNNQGYEQLMTLSSLLNVNGLTTLSLKDCSKYVSELICIFHPDNSSFKRLLMNDEFSLAYEQVNKYRSYFNEGDFYLGVTENNLTERMKSFHEQFAIPAVALTDVRHLNPDDISAYRSLRAMDQSTTLSDLPAEEQSNYFYSKRELEQRFSSFWPTLLKESERIVRSCQINLSFQQERLPSFPVPDTYDAASYLRYLCEKQLTIYDERSRQAALERLNRELRVITQMNFSDYFLIVADFVAYAKKKQIIVGPGRGSAAGSIVAYLLGITAVDPLKYNLVFERFLNEKRQSLPDIDIDFSDYRRDEVMQYIGRKYGHDKVAQIGTFGTFGKLSAIRELIKVLAIDEKDASYVINKMSISKKQSITETLKESHDLSNYIDQSHALKQLVTIAKKIEGLPRYFSTHAAGVIISDEPLRTYTPLSEGSEKTGLNVTQYAMNPLESLGLLKIDLLGLRNLTFVEQLLKRVNHHEKTQLTIETINEADEKTFSLLAHGMTNGVFQLESPGMKQVLTDLKPKSFEDIVAVNALYRPGPMEEIATYISRKENREQVSYVHEGLKEILAPTYGILIYQEQLIQIIHKVTNVSYGEADVIRRKLIGASEAERKEMFVNPAEKNGYEREVSENILQWLIAFANYGFNRSHAVSYSKITYALAYLKAHYPAYFFAELLTNSHNQTKKINEYIQEARTFSVHVLQPSINKSYLTHHVEKGNVRLGLLLIKGINAQDIQKIINERKERGKFSSLFDFCSRLANKDMKKRQIEHLIYAGAFDDLFLNRNSLLQTLDRAMRESELFIEYTANNDQSNRMIKLTETYKEVADFTKIEKLQHEKEYLGIYISSHPLENYRSLLASEQFKDSTQFLTTNNRRHIKVAAIIDNMRVIRTKRGESMAFLEVSDEYGMINVVVFPNVFRTISLWLTEEKLIFIEGKVEERQGKKQLIANYIDQFIEVEGEQAKETLQLFIKMADKNADELLNELKRIAQLFPGKSPIYIYQTETKQTYKLSEAYNIALNPLALYHLYKIIHKENIVIQ